MVEKLPGWPSWRYGPNGEAEIFHSPANVPAGWLDAPDAFKDEPTGDIETTDSPIPLSRKEIISALKERAISFIRNAPTAKLYAQLVEHVEKAEA